MKDFFLDLFQYNFMYNEKLLDLFEMEEVKISQKSKLLLSHLINAQNLWNLRILEEKHVYGVWETIPLELLRKMNQKNLDISIQIISRENLEKTVRYLDSKGNPFQNKLQDIIFHYLNHSTYHRAQIATEIRNSGLEPINTDFISFKRLL